MSKTLNYTIIVLYVLLLLSFTFSMSHYLPVLQRMWLFVVIGFVLPIGLNPSFYRSKTFFAYIIYIMIVALNYLFEKPYISSSGFFFRETYIMIIPASIFYILSKKKIKKLDLYFLYAFFAILIYTTVISFNLNLFYPGIIRTAFSAGREGGVMEGMAEGFYRQGLSSYELPHALPVLIPALIAVCKADSIKKSIKMLIIVILVTLLILVYISGSTTALAMATLSLIFSIFIGNANVSKNAKKLLLFFILLSPVYLNTEYQIDILEYIDSITGQDSGLHGKIMDIEDSIIYGSDDIGTVGARSERYKLTWEAFMNNILFGGDGGGGHSAIMDRLASLGIIGFIPLVFFVVTQIKYTKKRLPYKTLTYYYFGITIGLLMLVSKNMSNWYMWLCMFTILPLILNYYLGYEKEENTIGRSSFTHARSGINSTY